MSNLSTETKEHLFEYLLRLADDQLVLGQRIAEWCGHGPILEEDIALTNISLDLFGQAEMILGHAGELEGQGRDADNLAYFRDEYDFRNLQLVERPRGDFADTIVRQFLFDAYAWHLYTDLQSSSYPFLAAVAAKAIKETTYHLRHAREWLLRLGKGTEESHQRAQAALDRHWPFTEELFFSNAVDAHLRAQGMVPDPESIRPKWNAMVDRILAEAGLQRPTDPPYWEKRARLGQHSEHLGHMLAEMQIIARSHPGASW